MRCVDGEAEDAAVFTGLCSQPRGEALVPAPPQPSPGPTLAEEAARSLDSQPSQVFLLRNSWAWSLGELPELEEGSILPSRGVWSHFETQK